MKIKAKGEWKLFRHKRTGKVHIASRKKWSCACGMIANSGNFPGGTEVKDASEKELCKSCLKHTDAWEPVNEAEQTLAKIDSMRIDEPGTVMGSTSQNAKLDIIEPVDAKYHGSVPDYWGFALCGDCARGMNSGAYKDKGQWCKDCNNSYESLKRHSGDDEAYPLYTQTLKDALAENKGLQDLIASLIPSHDRLEEEKKNALAKIEELKKEAEILNLENEKLLAKVESHKWGLDHMQDLRNAIATYLCISFDLDCGDDGLIQAPATANKMICELQKKAEELGEQNQELKEDLGFLKIKLGSRDDMISELLKATNGHTLENIREIMKASQWAAEDLEGYKLDWGGDRVRRVPIVEYIEGDEITDEMVVANGGRVPCKWKNAIGDWVEGLLIAVDPNQETPSYVIMSKTSGAVGTGWKHCIIKKSDIEEN